MATPIVAVRLPKHIVKGLRREAHRESLTRDHEVSWVRVLCEAAEKYLSERQGRAAVVGAQ